MSNNSNKKNNKGDDNNNDDDDDDPSNPSSPLSSKARLIYFLTGGTGRGPVTMAGLRKMARQRNDVEKASKAWDAAGKKDLARHQGRWGRSGLTGSLDEARGVGPKPTGTALIRWHSREGSGARRTRTTTGQGEGETMMPAGQHEPEQQPQDDKHGVSDEEQGQGDDEKGFDNDHNGAGGETNPHQQPHDDCGEDHQGQDPDPP